MLFLQLISAIIVLLVMLTCVGGIIWMFADMVASIFDNDVVYGIVRLVLFIVIMASVVMSIFIK